LAPCGDVSVELLVVVAVPEEVDVVEVVVDVEDVVDEVVEVVVVVLELGTLAQTWFDGLETPAEL
jgi:hypothetical protein